LEGINVKLNRKRAPKMVSRAHFSSEYERFQKRQQRQERVRFTALALIAWTIIVLVWGLVK
jgi:hypothetical protein